MSIEKKIFRSGPLSDFIAQGIQVDNVLYMSGQVGVNHEGECSDNIATQVTTAYENMKEVLAEFGAGMDNIVDETFFVTDMNELVSNVKSVYGARAEAYGGLADVSQTVIQVSSLIQPELKVEIKCIAHL
jgi:2-iminobutanoate/2-iminopropanoate deaminase